MTSTRLALACLLVLAPLAACGGGGHEANGLPQCSDGIDNDGDGLIDFPADPGCTSPQDDSEDSPPSPQCSDGRDNDGDGKIDYPNDPGCPSPNGDSEVDDCPSGPNCPECSNGKDDDGNGLIDYPADPGCSSAGDPIEAPDDPNACGTALTVHQLPATNDVTGDITSTSSALHGSCGGDGGEEVYQLNVSGSAVVVATTNLSTTMVDSVLYIRSSPCTGSNTEVACATPGMNATGATVTAAVSRGTYFIVVDGITSISTGAFELTVNLYPGVGATCQGSGSDTTDCGPGLLCNGGMCASPECSDGIDNDGDGKIDYPNDPGCTSPSDNDETDDCPSGPNCPQCGNGIDDDGDGLIDYPADPQCKSASGTSEACTSNDPVLLLTTASVMGDTTNATDDFTPTCVDENGAPDTTYQLDLPALSAFTATIVTDPDGNFFDPVLQLLGATCAGTEVSCDEFDDQIALGAVAAGTYYLNVDGDDPTEFGAYTLTVSGTILPNQSCESALAQSGALTCGEGSVCKGTVGSRVCAPAQCSDGIDNDGDGKIDYPNDPGCTSPSDDDETDTCPGAGCPVCSDHLDNDADGLTDYPADYGCTSAAGASEVFCIGEVDPTSVIVAPTTSGTTVGKHDNETPDASCAFSMGANDVAYALELPIPVASLQIDTHNSTLDTVLSLFDANCMTSLECNDDDETLDDGTSILQLTNVTAGNYAIVVDGYDDNNGTFKLNIKGTVATGTVCTSPLFTEGVLLCPTGTTCAGGTCH